MRKREFKERKKNLSALKSGSTHIALAVQYKSLLACEFSQVAYFTAVMGLELFLRFPREKPSLTRERERERERERDRRSA
jgi:hypothetical protein